MKKTYGRCSVCGILWDREDMKCPNCKVSLIKEIHSFVPNGR